MALEGSYPDWDIFFGLRHVARIVADESVLKTLRHDEDLSVILHRERFSCRSRAQRL